MIHIDNLLPAGHDSWDRPLFMHKDTGQFFCCVDDLDATLDTIRAGAELYFKGDREGEPDYPVNLCRLPSLRCTFALEHDNKFHLSGIYPAFPQTDSASDTPNVLQIKDNIGHWRVMTWDALRFDAAQFAIVEAPLSYEAKLALYRAGRYAFASPGVPHGAWSENDWITHIDAHGVWLTED